MTKFPKLPTLTGDEKSKIFLASTLSPDDFFDPYRPPELRSTREHAKLKKYFLQNVI